MKAFWDFIGLSFLRGTIGLKTSRPSFHQSDATLMPIRALSRAFHALEEV